ncbi:hypothetical protein DPMN_134640 [Dreissena polymorpha]|uniref:Uncharacterized protein n=1 Tax=Dreissena polymorpha TaxID=45954 RepID=A0A9D4G035_DREPO|nr:hypothetical protein DPMN_134640 [Dreissena polymorpha]
MSIGKWTEWVRGAVIKCEIPMDHSFFVNSGDLDISETRKAFPPNYTEQII